MVDFSDVQRAGERLKGRVNRTEVTSDQQLGGQLGVKVCVKWESRQITGAFKVRGAMNAVLSLPEESRQAGVIASSSGSHGLGLSYAAKQAHIPATIVVSNVVSPAKLAGMRALGAEVIVVDGPYGLAEETARRLAGERDAVYISSYNRPEVVAGQGTIMLEWLEQAPDLDTVVVPVGGGGLSSGIGLVLKALRPATRLVGVQAEGSPVLYENWRGRDMTTVKVVPTLADGLTGRIDPQAITLPLTRRLLDDFVLVSDDEIARAIAYLYERHGEMVEGAGAAAMAALLAGKVEGLGRSVGVLATSGNITPQEHRDICARAARSVEKQAPQT